MKCVPPAGAEPPENGSAGPVCIKSCGAITMGSFPAGLSRFFHLHCSLIIQKVVCASHPCSSLTGLHRLLGWCCSGCWSSGLAEGVLSSPLPGWGLVSLAECGTGMWPEQAGSLSQAHCCPAGSPRLTVCHWCPSPAGLSRHDRDLGTALAQGCPG